MGIKKNKGSTGLKAFYDMNDKGLVNLLTDMLTLGLILAWEQIGSWFWIQTDLEVYKSRIQGKIPAFTLFFNRPCGDTKLGSRFTSEVHGSPIKNKAGLWTTGFMRTVKDYITTANVIKAVTDGGGGISSSLWLDDKGNEVTARPAKPKKEKAGKVAVKKPSEMTTDELIALNKSIQSLLKQKKA